MLLPAGVEDVVVKGESFSLIKCGHCGTFCSLEGKEYQLQGNGFSQYLAVTLGKSLHFLEKVHFLPTYILRK